MTKMISTGHMAKYLAVHNQWGSGVGAMLMSLHIVPKLLALIAKSDADADTNADARRAKSDALSQIQMHVAPRATQPINEMKF